MRLIAYFPRQLRDVLLTRGAAMLVIVVMLSLPLLLAPSSVAGDAQLGGAFLGRHLQGLSLFLIMVATYGIIGEDMRRGYFRFLFSKPISPVLYYVQAFVAALVAFFTVQLVMVGLFAVVVQPAWPGRAFLEMLASFVLLGAMIFGVSRLTRLDWLIGLFLSILGSGVRDWYPPAESFRGKLFNVLLPPSHLLDGPLFPATGIEWSHVLWVGGYAAVFLAIGLSLVRFVPMASQT